jgi:hypothetical protein
MGVRGNSIFIRGLGRGYNSKTTENLIDSRSNQMSSVNSGYYRKRLQSVRDRPNLNTKRFQTEWINIRENYNKKHIILESSQTYAKGLLMPMVLQFGFTVFWHWAYLMKVIQEMCCAHYIWYLIYVFIFVHCCMNCKWMSNASVRPCSH